MVPEGSPDRTGTEKGLCREGVMLLPKPGPDRDGEPGQGRAVLMTGRLAREKQTPAS